MAQRRISAEEQLAKLEGYQRANESEVRSIEDQVYFAKKRNMTEEFTALRGKLFLYRRQRYYCESILQSIEQSLSRSRLEIMIKFNRQEYADAPNYRTQFNQDDTTEFLDRKYSDITQWISEVELAMNRYKQSLDPIRITSGRK